MFCFVLLNYNALDVTIECINNIKKLTIMNKKIIIVDNDSESDGEKLKQIFFDDKIVDVVQSNCNVGFARGNNIGFKKAKEYSPDYIVIMNNDMKIKTIDFEHKITETFNKTDFDVMGPDIYSVKYKYHQNPQRSTNYSLSELKKMRLEYFFKMHLKFVFWLKWHILSRFMNVNKKNVKTGVKYIKGKTYPLHGSFYVFSKKFIKKHEDAFYNGTFMYMESYILNYLTVSRHEKMVYDPSIKVDHYEDVTTDRAYNDGYKKAIFTNKCMYDATNAFIQLLESRSMNR